MRKIKAIFFDVDSTLYTHRTHDFPSSAKEALRKLKQNGYKIAIATSRCRYELKNLPSFFREFAFDAKIVDGGALILEKDCVFEQYPIEKEQVERLISYCNEQGIAMRYSTLDNDYFNRPCDADIRDEFFKLYLNMPNVKPYEGEDVFNLLAYVTSDEQGEHIAHLLDRCSIISHSKKTREITAIGIDKSVGVNRLAQHWGIAMEEVVCFGDGANDVLMLQAAGIGIAMGNANQKAKDVADIICGHIDEDGVYKVCEELQLIGR